MLKQHYCGIRSVTIFLALLGCGALAPAAAGPTVPDPILLGAPSGPCQTGVAGADYVGGVDILGNPVAPADAADHRVTAWVANEIVVPEVLIHQPNLDRVRAQIRVDGLADALNPAPACAPPPLLRSPH